MTIDDYAAAVVGLVKTALGPVMERLAALEAARAALGDVRDRVVSLDATMSGVRDQIAALQVKAGVPGPPGPSGPAGRDGVDGIALDDLSVVQDADARTIAVQATVGARVKTVGRVTLPVAIYRGVWHQGQRYELGDSVTWAGSEWHCHEATTAKPGDGSTAWTLKVKRGRDGRDGRDAPGALPVVTAR